MERHLTPETQTKLDKLARRTNRGTDELLEEAVGHLVEYNEWFERKVNASIAAAKSGQIVPHEHVHIWIERRQQERDLPDELL